MLRRLNGPAALFAVALASAALPLCGCGDSTTRVQPGAPTSDASSLDAFTAEAAAPSLGSAADAAAAEGAGGGTDDSAPAEAAGGRDDGAAGDGGEAGALNPTANVRLSEPRQIIDGFGVSNAWISAPDPSVRTAVYDALFSVTKGAGLSILRNRIPFRENPMYDDQFLAKKADGTYAYATNADGSKTFSLNWGNWDVTNTSALIAAIAAKGADYQVSTFLSTPWSPPNDSVNKWKLSDANKTIDYVNKPEQGGYLDPAHYGDYADVLADYVLGYKAKMGVDLSALSLQNEPSFQAGYESADWSAQQFHDFIAVLKTELTKKGVPTRVPNLRIVAPEDPNMKESLILPTLNDPSTAGTVGIVAAHQYELGPSNAPSYVAPVLSASAAKGKPIWMTEWSTAAWGTDATIADGLIVAQLLHQDLTITNVNAFFYWWAWGAGNSALVVLPTATSYVVPKRLYAMGQYSRFARPGWRRVATTTSPAPGVSLTAFEDPTATRVAIVAINAGAAQARLPLSLDVGRLAGVTVYRTSATEDLANVGSLAGGATIDVTLEPRSVTTFASAIGP